MALKLKEIHVEIASPSLSVSGFSLPKFMIKGALAVDDSDQRAAWELYIELVTRIATQELEDDEGLLREALSSLYAMFGETRKILRQHGPSVGRPKKSGSLSLGQIAVDILNCYLRPVLAYWHPELRAYEETRDSHISPVEHERKWARATELRKVLKLMQQTLLSYTVCLANAAGVPPIQSIPRRKSR